MNVTVRARQFIFEEERPFASCHASTVLKLPQGGFVASWFGGSREGADDVAIWAACRLRGGEWSRPVKVADEEGLPHWNPVLFQRRDGMILLYYKVGKPIKDWHTRVVESSDGGATWSEPCVLVDGDCGGRGPVKNKPIVLQDGRWLAPASTEGDFWRSFADISFDEGGSWEQSNMIGFAAAPPVEPIEGEVPPVPAASLQGRGVIQPTIWESAPGTAHMLMRSSATVICRSDSFDGGRTWCPAYPTDLPGNNSGIDLAPLAGGTLALVFNPVPRSWGMRTPLVIRFSQDNGLTWNSEFILENEPGEFSYPAVISDGNELYVTYTWKRERIAFWHLTVEPSEGKEQ